MTKEKKMIKKKCFACNKEFFVINSSKRFCELRCYRKYYRKINRKIKEPIKRKCLCCNKKFLARDIRIKYCQRKCYLIDYRKKNREKTNEYNKLWMQKMRYEQRKKEQEDAASKKRKNISSRAPQGHCKLCGIRLIDWNKMECKIKKCPYKDELKKGLNK